MIKELTKEQENLFGKYVEEYTKLGLSTDRVDKKFAEPIIHEFQEKILKCEKTSVLILDNPLQCFGAICFLADSYIHRNKVYTNAYDKIYDKVREKISHDVYRNVIDNLCDNVHDEVYDKIRYQTCGKISDEMRIKLYAKLKEKVCPKVIDKVYDKICDKMNILNIYPYQDCSFWVGTFSFYSYIQEVVGVDLEEFNYSAWRNTAQLGLIYPLDSVCIVCQKPKSICLNEAGNLHSDGKPAISYEGDFNIYCLNGITVSEKLAMTPAEKLNIDLFLKEQNVDVKAEFIRKYGIERMLEHGKLVDTYKNYRNNWWDSSEYELWDMREVFEGVTKHKQCCFLKMKNQTTGTWHLEGVSPNFGEVKTISQALGIREKIQDAIKETIWMA